MRPGRAGVARVPLREIAGLAVVIAAAVVLRFLDLPTRGQWDADQGHDMLVLHGMTQLGQWPLLGPPTSIGSFHHGVLYYYLLAPAAWLSGSDPVAVTAMIAIAGVAAVTVTWWLGRSIGGPVAGLVAGLLMAVSASAVEESTFIWNPNLIALSSAIAVAAAWRAWTGERARPLAWSVAFGATIVTMHCHVLGSVLAPAIVVPWIVDVRRRGGGPDRRRLLTAGAAGIVLLLLSYLPLAIHEASNDLSEVRAALGFVAGGGDPSSIGLLQRVVVIALRVLAWPLAGLVTSAPVAAVLAAAGVVASLAWMLVAGTPAERAAARWFGLTLVWTVVALTVVAGGLAAVVPRLPNDHYHAFVDPIVFVTAGLGVAGLVRGRTDAPRTLGRAWPTVAGLVIVVAVVGFNLVRQPPAVSPDGGWPAGDLAAERVLDQTGGPADRRVIVLHSLPEVKSVDAVRFPLIRRGADAPEQSADSTGWEALPHVVLCDALFETAIGAPCGGPAEDPVVAPYGQRLVDRFLAAPDRWVSVYLPD